LIKGGIAAAVYSTPIQFLLDMWQQKFTTAACFGWGCRPNIPFAFRDPYGYCYQQDPIILNIE